MKAQALLLATLGTIALAAPYTRQLSSSTAGGSTSRTSLVLGGVVGHQSELSDSGNPSQSWVAAGLELFRNRYCSDPNVPCLRLEDSNGQFFGYDLELRWETIGSLPGVPTQQHQLAAALTSVTSTPGDDVGPVHALVGTTTSTGHFPINFKTGISTFFEQEAEVAEGLGIPYVQPLVSVDEMGGQPTTGFFLSNSIFAAGDHFLEKLQESGITKLAFTTAYDWETPLCTHMIEAAPSYGVTVVQHVRIGSESHAMPDGAVYTSTARSWIPDARLNLRDAGRIAALSGAEALYHCVQALDDLFVPQQDDSASFEDTMYDMFADPLGLSAMRIVGISNIFSEYSFAPLVPDLGIILASQLAERPATTDFAILTPWSSMLGKEFGYRSELVHGWATADAYIFDQMQFNQQVLKGSTWPQWGNAGGAASGEVLVSAFLAAFRECAISQEAADINLLLYDPDVLSCASGPALGNERWIRAIAATQLHTVLGRVEFAGAHGNSALTQMPQVMAVHPTSPDEQIAINIVAPPGIANGTYCIRGLPGCAAAIPTSSDAAPVSGLQQPVSKEDGDDGSSGGSHTHLPWWLWLVIGCAILLSAITLGAAVIHYRLKAKPGRSEELGRSAPQCPDEEACTPKSGSGTPQKAKSPYLSFPTGQYPSLASRKTPGGTEFYRSMSGALNNSNDVFTAKLGDMLGHGSYGEVYSAKWNGAELAVKTMRTRKFRSTDKIIEETQLHLSLRHPNVVAVYGWGARPYLRANYSTLSTNANQMVESDTFGQASSGRQLLMSGDAASAKGDSLNCIGIGTSPDMSSQEITEVWMIQELCNRGSLKRAILADMFHMAPAAAGEPADRTPPNVKLVCNERAALQALIQISSAGIYLHKMNVIHGDIKPDNILVTGATAKTNAGPNDVLTFKLADFGNTRFIAMGETHASATSTGTLAFSAPEVVANQRYEKASDVYAFGGTMYEMCTCQNVHQGYSSLATMQRVVDPKFAPRFAADFPPFLADVACACLAYDPKARPTFEALYHALTARLVWLNNERDGVAQGPMPPTALLLRVGPGAIPKATPSAVSSASSLSRPWFSEFMSAEDLMMQAETAIYRLKEEAGGSTSTESQTRGSSG